MIYEGLKLMIIGMGVVFFFLILLYGIISFSGIYLKKFSLLEEEENILKAKQEADKRKKKSVLGKENSIPMAAISAAIFQFRNKK